MGIENKTSGEDDSTLNFSPEQKEKPKEIKDAKDLDDLCEILLEKGTIIGSKSRKHPEGNVYSAEDIVGAIKNIKKLLIDRVVKHLDIPAHQIFDAVFNGSEIKTAFTRTDGLRDKVMELFKQYTEDAVRKDALDLLKFKEEEVDRRGDSLADPEL